MTLRFDLFDYKLILTTQRRHRDSNIAPQYPKKLIKKVNAPAKIKIYDIILMTSASVLFYNKII